MGQRFVTDEERGLEPPEQENEPKELYPVGFCDMCRGCIYKDEEAWYWEEMTLCSKCMEEVVDEAKATPWREFARDYMLASEIRGG